MSTKYYDGMDALAGEWYRVPLQGLYRVRKESVCWWNPYGHEFRRVDALPQGAEPFPTPALGDLVG